MRLTAQMAQKMDLETKAYWQKKHEKAVEARREKERKYRYLRAISHAASLEAKKAAFQPCSASPLAPDLGHSTGPPTNSN